MILLRSNDLPSGSIALFGRGLIGSAIVSEVEGRGFARVHETALPWNDRAACARRIEEIERSIVAAAPHRESADSRGEALTMIWSAGRAGFDATEEETSAELTIFQGVVELARRLAGLSSGGRIAFVLFGSAGGLFEGQRVVGPRSTPVPRRPYGRLKLEMENRLRSASDRIEPTIFRLASVYGLLAGRRRRGLVPTLIANAFERRVSRIVGTPSTLRDFVWVGDVARFVVSRILEDPDIPREPILTLASGRPASILEIRKRVEERLGRRLFISYVRDQNNREDITFAPGTMPAGWRPSDLATNIGLIASDFLASGLPFASA